MMVGANADRKGGTISNQNQRPRARDRIIAVSAAAVAVSIVAMPAQGSLVSYWDFNDSNTTRDGGTSGSLTVTTAVTASYGTGTTLNAVSPSTAGNAIRLESKNNSSPNFVFSLPTTGLSNLAFSYATTSDSGSFATQTIEYSTNGTSYTTLATVTPSTVAFTAQQYDLSAITALNNNVNAKIRITFNSGGNGNSKYNTIDNVQLTSGNDSLISAPAAASFGRVLVGQTPTQNVTLTKTGILATSYSATPSAGLTVTADGAIGSNAQSETIGVQLANNASGSASTGAKSLSVVIDNTATDSHAGGGSSDANDSIAVSATVVANRDLTAGTANLGRVMINTNSGSVTTTVNGGSADDDNATRVNLVNGTTSSGGVTVTRAGGTNLFDTSNETASVGVVGNFSTVGVKTGSVNVASLLTNGETTIAGTPTLDSSVLVGYTATAVDNRKITAGSTGSPINVGKVLIGHTKVISNQSFESAAARDVATDIQLLASGGTVTDGNGTFTIGSGSAVNFDGTTTTGERSLSFNFGTSGTRTAQTASVANATAKIENLTGETLQPVGITYSADVYEAVELSFNNASPIGAGGAIQVSNAPATGAQRAAAKVTSRAITGQSSGWTISGLTPNTAVAAGSISSGTAVFNSNGKLNGTYLGTLTLNLAYDDATIQGIGAIPSQTWDLQTTVSGVVANAGQGSVRSGHSYAGFGLTRDSGKQTQATFLAGTSSADRDFQLTFSDPTPNLYSDELEINATNGDLLVLQMSYDPTGLTETQEQALVLMWLNGSGQWVNAVLGNTDGGASATSHLGAYNSSLFSLGNYGVDTTNNVAWAVIDHNSSFGVALVPEPASLSLLAIAGLVTGRRRR